MINNYDVPLCPDCGSILTVRDSKRRSVKDANGHPHIFNLRRLKCTTCNKLHTEIPDFIATNKHFRKDVIESVINGNCDYCSADDSTLYRWKHL